MRIFYGLKLIVLINANNNLGYSNLSFFGLLSLVLIISCILLLVNIHIRILGILRYGVIEFKYLIYCIIGVYLVVRVLKFGGLLKLRVMFRVILKDLMSFL